MKKTKILLFLFIGAIIAVIACIAFVWNKPPETVNNKDAMIVSVDVLVKAFEKDEQHANSIYLGKAIQVKGEIEETIKNQNGQTVVRLRYEDPMSGVQGTMKDKELKVEAGQTVTIKGFCNGYIELTGVLLSDCIVVE